MPIHDWTRVRAGTFHDFYVAWIAELRRALNDGLLPDDYYAQAEQVTGEFVPDVLTLQDARGASDQEAETWSEGEGGLAVAVAPPKVSHSELIFECGTLAERRKVIAIRHTSGDRVVALLEIVSPGNKRGRSAVSAFVDKAAGTILAGYHLIVLDLLPPGLLDPDGMHARVWERLGGLYDPPTGKPLTLAAYAAGQDAINGVRCYVEPTAVGTPLIDMPLFLNPTHYVNVPLEPTYAAAYEGVPRKWKRVIEGAT